MAYKKYIIYKVRRWRMKNIKRTVKTSCSGKPVSEKVLLKLLCEAIYLQDKPEHCDTSAA